MLGDMIKNGRRGSLSGKLIVKGVQGHIAYPQLARNPIHLAAPALAELAAERWDDGNEYFLPTSLADLEHPCRHRRQQHHSGRGGDRLQLPLLHRQHARGCKRACTRSSTRHGLDYDLTWTLGGQPFLTPRGTLSDALSARDPARDRRRRPNCRPPAAPPTAASSRRSARR